MMSRSNLKRTLAGVAVLLALAFFLLESREQSIARIGHAQELAQLAIRQQRLAAQEAQLQPMELPRPVLSSQLVGQSPPTDDAFSGDIPRYVRTESQDHTVTTPVVDVRHQVEARRASLEATLRNAEEAAALEADLHRQLALQRPADTTSLKQARQRLEMQVRRAFEAQTELQNCRIQLAELNLNEVRTQRERRLSLGTRIINRRIEQLLSNDVSSTSNAAPVSVDVFSGTDDLFGNSDGAINRLDDPRDIAKPGAPTPAPPTLDDLLNRSSAEVIGAIEATPVAMETGEPTKSISIIVDPAYAAIFHFNAGDKATVTVLLKQKQPDRTRAVGVATPVVIDSVTLHRDQAVYNLLVTAEQAKVIVNLRDISLYWFQLAPYKVEHGPIFALEKSLADIVRETPGTRPFDKRDWGIGLSGGTITAPPRETLQGIGIPLDVESDDAKLKKVEPPAGVDFLPLDVESRDQKPNIVKPPAEIDLIPPDDAGAGTSVLTPGDTKQSSIAVLRARMNIARGEPFTHNRVRTIKYASRDVPDGAITSMSELADQWAKVDINADDTIVKGMLMPKPSREDLARIKMERTLAGASPFPPSWPNRGGLMPISPITMRQNREQLPEWIAEYIKLVNERLAESSHAELPRFLDSLGAVLAVWSEGDAWDLRQTGDILTTFANNNAESGNATYHELAHSETLLRQIARITGKVPESVQTAERRDEPTRRKLELLTTMVRNKADNRWISQEQVRLAGLFAEAPWQAMQILIMNDGIDDQATMAHWVYALSSHDIYHDYRAMPQVLQAPPCDAVLLLAILETLAGRNSSADERIGYFIGDPPPSLMFGKHIDDVLSGTLAYRETVLQLLSSIHNKSTVETLKAEILKLAPGIAITVPAKADNAKTNAYDTDPDAETSRFR